MEIGSNNLEKIDIDKKTYDLIKKSVDFSYEEFLAMKEAERLEWVDACRLAKLLSEEKGATLYEGYYFTNMFDKNGNFDLGYATSIVRSKKRTLSVIEKYTDIDLTPAQFILLGEKGTQEVVNQGLKIMNQATAKVLDEGRLGEAERIKGEVETLASERARLHTEEFYKKYGNGFDEDKATYWK